MKSSVQLNNDQLNNDQVRRDFSAYLNIVGDPRFYQSFHMVLHFLSKFSCGATILRTFLVMHVVQLWPGLLLFIRA